MRTLLNVTWQPLDWRSLGRMDTHICMSESPYNTPGNFHNIVNQLYTQYTIKKFFEKRYLVLKC